ncbi:DUF397 domain-containing protein [Dactylosporangium sp. CS-033363]|uniref:DUF397 domain-containing protein n=1 Tax=Dactylosporangium sp. CS-033363 TaxID=3239935 RepID=UPI003D931E41
MQPNQPKPRWQVSTRTGANGNCVEAALNLPSVVLVRDSKNRTGPHITFDRTAWSAFIGAVHDGTFDQ